MRKTLVTLVLFLAIANAIPQGLVNFYNNSTTAVYWSSWWSPVPQPISGPPGSYYFGLLTAPPGPIDWPQGFTFTGIYATNTGVAGMFSGGTAVAVPGWAAGMDRNYFVAGWSADKGRTWQQSWLTDSLSQPAFFGVSAVTDGVAGGFNGTASIPPFNLFDLFDTRTGLPGFSLGTNLVPEPSTLCLALLGATTLMLHLRTGQRKLG